MSDFLTRARAEAERRWTFETAAYDSLTIDQRRGRRIGFELGALWAAEQDPSDAEVEAAFEAFDDGVRLYDNMRAALIAARDARRGVDR